MSQPMRSKRRGRLKLSTTWAYGSQTRAWDVLWTRLLAYALERRALPDEANCAVALRDPSDSEPSATSDDSRRPDDEQRGP